MGATSLAAILSTQATPPATRTIRERSRAALPSSVPVANPIPPIPAKPGHPKVRLTSYPRTNIPRKQSHRCPVSVGVRGWGGFASGSCIWTNTHLVGGYRGCGQGGVPSPQGPDLTPHRRGRETSTPPTRSSKCRHIAHGLKFQAGPGEPPKHHQDPRRAAETPTRTQETPLGKIGGRETTQPPCPAPRSGLHLPAPSTPPSTKQHDAPPFPLQLLPHRTGRGRGPGPGTAGAPHRPVRLGPQHPNQQARGAPH